MNENTLLDFSSTSGKEMKGTISLTREANEDSEMGFYLIQNSQGAVLDPITGNLIFPGEYGYEEAALDSINIFNSFGKLSTKDINAVTQTISNYDGASIVNINNKKFYELIPNRSKVSKEIYSFSEDDLVAPYAVTSSGKTFFSFNEANEDNFNHFRNFGAGSFGLESSYNGGDKDFDDLIVSFDFQLV